MGPTILLEKIVRTFERLGIPYLITGSVAAIIYGEPRMTNDIDVVAALEQNNSVAFIKEFPPDEYYISEDAVKEAILLGRQFNIINPSSGFKVDVIVKSRSAFDESRFARVRKTTAGEGLVACFASPEDVIVKKLEYFRMGGSEKHLRDIAGIMKISGDQLDLSYIRSWCYRMKLIDIWDELLEKVKK